MVGERAPQEECEDYRRPLGRCSEMHIEISFLKEAEKVEKTNKLIDLGKRTMILAQRGGDADGVFLHREEISMGFSCTEEELQKCFPVYINRPYLPMDRPRVALGIVSCIWPRHVICNLVELRANLIHLNMMRAILPRDKLFWFMKHYQTRLKHLL
jgi:hypothetical protein